MTARTSGVEASTPRPITCKLAERCAVTRRSNAIRAQLNRIGAPGTRTQNGLDLGTARTGRKLQSTPLAQSPAAEQKRGLLSALVGGTQQTPSA
jgi:hypothetical protein